ncbi:hypothetical protein [Dictyobacter formicarum]|uniref:Uncharacterized protein n=1 Tax=Dictyobacter formicarum TaxID=2778368 RepID=A0ABQ3VAT9_9CHLR|nr:hypothetical protein [Dictyobacter formicarum]GHO83002.1 hypothetical protein KSZ_10080 [Dictyobacter formicarum]
MEEVLVDIDGVLATGHVQRFVALCNDILQLAIPIPNIASIASLREFGALPQVSAHRTKVGSDRFRRQMELMRWHPLNIVGCRVIDGSVEGIQYLAQRSSSLQYCTARFIEFDAAWNTDVANSTKSWLKNNDFPNAELVMFCESPRAKLTTIAAMVRAQKQPVYLIDDSLDLLLDAFDTLSMRDRRVLKTYLTLIAFDHCEEECNQSYPLRVVPLQSWQEIQCIEKEFHHV